MDCEQCTIFVSGNEVDDPRVAVIRNAGRDGISDNPDEICTGSNSGHQLVNIVYLAGASKIVLLGYDGKPGSGGKHHWFGSHPDNTQAPYEHMCTQFRKVAEHLKGKPVQVINASPGSAIDAFPRMSIEEALA